MPELLSPEVGRAFYGNFKVLRPAQQDAIDPILRGNDVIILASTGSGKTEAVVAPLIQRYLPVARRAINSSILYITPTRALANDLARRLEKPLDELGLLVGIRHGDQNDLGRKQKPDLLITTPESFDVLLMNSREMLKDVNAVIMDEVHLTYNTQRGFQVAVLLKRLEQVIGRSVQVVGLSATVANPADIWAFFRPGRTFETVHDPDGKPLDYLILDVGSPTRLAALLNRVGDGRKAKILIFVNSRKECDSLSAELLNKTIFGDKIFVHHSSLDGKVRKATEQTFFESRSAVCIATSTLELGIDIGDIDLVMLYGHPGGWESFLQRIGRGNRRTDKTSIACLVSPNHGPSFRTILSFEALISQIRQGRLEREQPLHIYGAASQQLLSVLASTGAFVRIADLADLFSDWPYLDRQTLEQLLDGLVTESYVTRHGFKHQYAAGEQLHRLQDLRLVWGNFPVRSREVKLITSGRLLGTIPASNLLRLTPGLTIRFAGRSWHVRRIQPDLIEVEPSRKTEGIELTYSGAGIPMDPTNLEEMLRVLENGVQAENILPETRSWFVPAADKMQKHIGWDRIPVARDDTDYNYFTFAGKLVNQVIAKWAEVSSNDVDNIVLKSPKPIDFSQLPSDLHELEAFATQCLQIPSNLTIFQNILPIQLLERELVDLWIKTPVFSRSLIRLRSARLHPAPLADLAPLCT